MGFLVDFLSHAVIVGFMGGAAIVIGLQQLKGLLGMNHFTTKTDIISVFKAVVTSFQHPVSKTFPWKFPVLTIADVFRITSTNTTLRFL